MAAEYPTEQIQPEPRSTWHDYGPPILGAIVILAVLVGGWYFWRLRTQSLQETQEVAQVEEQEASSSPTPSPEETAQAREAPEVEVTMSEPEELPATGFPQAAIAAISLLAFAAGWKLRKIK